MINLVLNGCNGKMGQVITKLVQTKDEFSNTFHISGGFDISNTIENKYPVYTNLETFDGKVDVIIDFSHPDSLNELLHFSLKHKIPTVVATTGLNQKQILQLNTAATKIPIFFSANMSLGVNLLMELACEAAKFLEDSFDIEIIEKHHNQKIDAPSGTALFIADKISESLSKNSEYIYDRHSVRKKRNKNEIGIHSVRGGTIVGEHSVIFAGNDEIIEIKHQAMSKEIFAVGALKAAKFLIDKKPGMYSMKELIKS